MSTDPGIIRSLERITTDDGFVLVCAVDHLAEFEELLGPVGSVSFAEVVTAKAAVVAAVAADVSAVLLDPRFGIGHLPAAGILPAGVGLIASIEEENYEFPNGPRASIMRPGWTAAKAKAAGADMIKFLWFYRPDLDAEVAASQRALLQIVSAACRSASIPLVVEPIWFPVPGEDTSSPEWRRKRVEGILSSATTAADIGLDMLKVEFPGDVSTEQGREDARAACARLDDSVSVPWVILSAGVGYDDFRVQLSIASAAGASGYMAGRSVWREAVTGGDVTLVAERIRALNDIVREHGRPVRPTQALPALLAAVSPDWYR
ncbi:tagatose 1,6-diphosphate aldolase [Microbacterium saperdae]